MLMVFGLAWYEHAIDDIPGVFKSIRPAWNDNNLKSIAAKVKSKCFMAQCSSIYGWKCHFR